MTCGRIAVAGHSCGTETASTLLSARVLDSDSFPGEEMSAPRITVGVLLALAGLCADLTPFAVVPVASPARCDTSEVGCR